MAGERLARQGIFFERRFEADSAEGRLICDEIVEPGEMDAAIARTVEQLTASGTVSAAARAINGNKVIQFACDTPNRKADNHKATEARQSRLKKG
jgi:hypothetical protein